MKRIYYLGSCDKCRKILKILEQSNIKLEKQDIKVKALSKDQLVEMRSLVESYEQLFSKSARKYRTLENKDKLTEKDYEKLILSEYTYLKRPILLDEERIFIGVNPNNMDGVVRYFST
ncbi:MAG: arsenate reductase family protein [Flavobacteriales bacterium]